MPFSLSTVRNTREQFVLQKIEYYKVMEHISKSDWERHYFDTYKEAIKMFKKLKQTKRRVLIFACRDNELGELSTGLNDRFKDE